ncbi:hypothetical protein AB1Y20_014366 [Prymnesium parvum]|uniref:Actin-related protein 8 n=1 Tax=Prymnesium parvum TaxID=97485 RepID=A0AB34IG62_PRYPA
MEASADAPPPAPAPEKKPKAPKEPKPPKEPGAAPKRSRPSGGSSSKRAKAESSRAEESLRAATPVAHEENGEELEAAKPDPTVGRPVVVIHPGSKNLRVGLSDQVRPLLLPHCIAHRRASPPPAPPADASEPDTASTIESSLDLLARQLRVATLLLGGEEAPSVHPTATCAPGGAAPAAAELPAVLVGEAALQAAEAHPTEYDLYYPLARTRFNYANSCSMMRVLSALETIWRSALFGGAGIEGLGLQVEAREACVVLVLPDLFDRREGSELLQLLFRTFGFHAAIIHEEAACAAFGAGVTSACVVDLGAQRCSVSCIDEGMPMAGCRLVMSYGGDDMDALLRYLLCRQGLLAALPPLARGGGGSEAEKVGPNALLARIRHACCHLKFGEAAPPASEVALRMGKPQERRRQGEGRCTVSLGSFAAVPPLLLFSPQACLALHGWQVKGAKSTIRPADPPEQNRVDYGDVWDDEFLQESAAPLRVIREALEGKDGAEVLLSATQQAALDMREQLMSQLPQNTPLPFFTSSRERERAIARETAANLPMPNLTTLGMRQQSGLTPDELLEFMPLDEAVVRAVEKGKSTEVKRRLYGTILLIGGASRTAGLAPYLEWRVACCWRLAPDSTEGIERVEVVKLPANMSPEAVSWQGGALLPTLESARELWITQKEWSLRGAMAARESCAFSW